MPKPKETKMLNVYNHEGEFTYKIDGKPVTFDGAEIFITADASVVYGRTAEGREWEIDSVVLIYAVDDDGYDLKLTSDEEKKLEALMASELLNNSDIDEKVHELFDEIIYWESRR